MRDAGALFALSTGRSSDLLVRNRRRPLGALLAFNVSFFSGLKDTRAQLSVGLDWPTFVAQLGPPKPFLRKDAAPLISPGEWHAGHGPSKEEGLQFFVGVHFGCFDFDDLHESDMPKAVGVLERSNIAHLVVSSFKYNGKRKHPARDYKEPAKPGIYYQLRVLFPFTRMVTASEWRQLWEALDRLVFQGVADKACKDPTRRYYVPSYPEGSEVHPVYEDRPGGLLDVDGLLASLGPPPREASPSTVSAARTELTRHDLGRIARALKTSTKKRELGEALGLIIRGEPYAQKGSRHGLTVRLVREILDRHPGAEHEAIADAFAPSLALMQPTHINRDVLLGFCTWKDPVAPKVDHTTRVAEAFNGARGEAYAPEDVLQMAEVLHARPDELMRRWIIQKGDSYYVLCDGVYRCYSSSDVINAVLRDLAPAASVGVDLHEVTPRGMRRKTILELMANYGTVANEIVVDLTCQKAFYDPVSRSFVEAPCPIRVTSKYDAAVEKWLQLLVGTEHAGLLNDWIASVTNLDEPCAALYLEGARGTGKSLFAHGIARIFSDRPSTLEGALGNFNEEIVSCPIVFGDETVPKDSRGRIRTDAIREFIQARSRALNRKHKPTATAKGALRLILAANNRNLLATLEDLTDHDIGAISERFVTLTVRAEAREYLETQNAPKWMDEDRIARHAMWLVENWEVEKQGRFMVKGDNSELINSLTTTSGLRSSICQWIVGLLLNPNPYLIQHAKDKQVKAEQGRLMVTARAIAEAWTLYIPERGTPPTPTAVARALGGLSKEVFVHEGARTGRMREVDLKNLGIWGRDTGYIDEAQIPERIAVIERDTAVMAVRGAAAEVVSGLFAGWKPN